MPQCIAAEDHGANPENPAKHVEEHVTDVRHFRGAGHGRTKRSNDGNEPREDHGPAAIFFVEIMSALQMAAAEKERVFAAVEGCSRGAADPVTDLIAGDGA